jgi:L-ascorbate metabolism protein UlaG (beta-lactamase superfamily)
MAVPRSGNLASGRTRRVPLRLTHFGAAGWSITDGRTVVLLDPYLSRLRFRGRAYGPAEAPVVPGDTRPIIDMENVPASDTGAIDAHVQEAHFILLSHSHFNHCMDVPSIARKTGATVIGTESTANVARGGGVSEEQILTVRGGEDYQFEAISIRVIPSLHSALSGKHYFQSGTIPPVQNPLQLRDYLEGGTLAYLLRIAGRQVLVFGSMNYLERELEGLRPDAVLVAAARPRREIHRYTERLLRVLGRPPTVIATHWDNQGLPFGAPQDEAMEEAATFVREVKAVAPRSRVLVPRHFETLTV